ncbi:coilin [Betta splendens]|uniref:Coilin n=1 Tax=Betta splendens TaxID=158456 RepID=A0A6P7N5W7_BETSP|nr:coilin [Betta splendens]
MAAYSNSGTNGNIRVRLYFDYPPPAVVDSRMCWLLVDLNKCRVVADLESIIKEKFEFSRGSILNLFIEDCYLPHTESVYVVRDNDSVRVKVHCLTQVNGLDGCSETPKKKCRKRHRAEGEPPGEDGANTESKKKKREKRKMLDDDAREASGDERKSQGKHTGRRKKRKKTEADRPEPEADPPEPEADPPKPAASSRRIPQSVESPVKCTVKPTAATQEDSSSDSSSTLKAPPKKKPSTSASLKDASESQKTPPDSPPGSSDSEEEIDLVSQPERPGSGSVPQGSGRGCGGGQDREQGTAGHSGSLFEFSDGTKVSSYHTDSLSNVSFVLQNGAGSVPTQDYSSMPLLAAPPQVGQKIAFKLLELTENYSPEVSEYKEGRIVSFDPTTKQIELELLHVSEAPTEPGKFDLVYQNPDGTERVEYAVSRGAWVTERWDSLLEPRLIL